MAVPAVDSSDAPPAGASVQLSAREQEILVLIAEGQTNEEIARTLILGRETIKTHVKTMLRKLAARNRSHAVALAFRLGLLE